MYQDFYNLEEKHWWFLARRKIVFSVLKQYLPNKNQLEILDVGCGTGSTLKELEKRGQVIGVDVSEEAVKFCRLRGCRNVYKIGRQGLFFEDEMFDLVVALGKLTYFNTFLFPFVLLARMGQRLTRMVNGRHKPRSDLKLYPFIINDLLEAIFMLEEGLLRKYDLPYGVSLLCVAKKA